MTKSDFIVLANRQGRSFGEKVVKDLKSQFKKDLRRNIRLTEIKIENFNNGELNIILPESVREKDVHLIAGVGQGEGTDMYQDIFEILIICDTLNRAGSRKIILYIPFLPFQRQDAKTEGREPISAKLIFNLLVASAPKPLSRIVTTDLHNDAAQGFLDIPIDNLKAMPLFVLYYKSLKELKNRDLLVVSPDPGGAKRARRFAQLLGVPWTVMPKIREKAKEAKLSVSSERFDGKTVIIPDDMIDTGGSIVKGAEFLRENGASFIYACCTHGIFSQNENGVSAEDRLRKSGVKVLTTDTIPRSSEYYHQNSDWLSEISIAEYFADALYANQTSHSVSEILDRQFEEARKKEGSIKRYLIK
ncbi:MAG: ribose-phosphate diphosphokinase [Candidatus Aminicenantes bacterium]|nr:ribose-phosphate diphosphokinase [Candidatus Aminicenantes bacterium]